MASSLSVIQQQKDRSNTVAARDKFVYCGINMEAAAVAKAEGGPQK